MNNKVKGGKMMKNLRSHLLTTSSILILSLASATTALGTRPDVSFLEPIGQNDSLDVIAGKQIRVSKQSVVRDRDQDPEAEETDHNLRPLVNATHEDLNRLRQHVLGHQTFLFKNDRTAHKRDTFTPSIKTAFESIDPDLRQVNFEALMGGLRDSLFEKEFQYLVSNIRNERSGDLSGLDFVNNRDGNPSISVGQLGIAIPIYDNERGTLENNALTPAGKNVNTVTANLVRRLLNESPQNLKRGLRLKIDNPQSSEEDILNLIRNILIPRQVGNSYIITPLGELIAGHANRYVDANPYKLPPYRDAVRQIGYIIGNTLYDTLNQTLQFGDIRSVPTRQQFVRSLQNPIRDHLDRTGLSTAPALRALVDNAYFTGTLLDILSNFGIVKFSVSNSPVTSKDRHTLYMMRNAHWDFSLYSPLTDTYYPVFADERGKPGSLLAPVDAGMQRPLMTLLEQGLMEYAAGNNRGDDGYVKRNKLDLGSHLSPYRERMLHLSHVAYKVFKDYMDSLVKPDHLTSIRSRESFESLMKEAFIHHLGLTGLKELYAGKEYVFDVFAQKLMEQAFGLAGSSKSLILAGHPVLKQSFTKELNGKKYPSIFSSKTNLHYPIFSDVRALEGSFLPSDYMKKRYDDTIVRDSTKLMENGSRILTKNNFFDRVESLKALTYVLNSILPQAEQYSDDNEFTAVLKDALVHHLDLTGTSNLLVNNTLNLKGYVNDILSERLHDWGFGWYPEYHLRPAILPANLNLGLSQHSDETDRANIDGRVMEHSVHSDRTDRVNIQGALVENLQPVQIWNARQGGLDSPNRLLNLSDIESVRSEPLDSPHMGYYERYMNGLIPGSFHGSQVTINQSIYGDGSSNSSPNRSIPLGNGAQNNLGEMNSSALSRLISEELRNNRQDFGIQVNPHLQDQGVQVGNSLNASMLNDSEESYEIIDNEQY